MQDERDLRHESREMLNMPLLCHLWVQSVRGRRMRSLLRDVQVGREVRQRTMCDSTNGKLHGQELRRFRRRRGSLHRPLPRRWDLQWWGLHLGVQADL